MNILNSLLPVATFIIGFALNWFIGRKEFYFRFYREKELQVLAELNKELRVSHSSEVNWLPWSEFMISGLPCCSMASLRI